MFTITFKDEATGYSLSIESINHGDIQAGVNLVSKHLIKNYDTPKLKPVEPYKVPRVMGNHVPSIDGIKTFTDGKILYQCTYSCKCGNTGLRFVKKDAQNASCHRCHSNLVMYAVDTDFIPDEDFNYFYAVSSNTFKGDEDK